jgi:hypothetical protein
MEFKDKIVLVLVSGIFCLLSLIVVGDFIVALEENRPVDDAVVRLLQISITGLIGILGTYFGMRSKDK